MQTAPSEELMIRIVTVLNTHRGSAYINGLKSHISDVPAKQIDVAIAHMKEKKNGHSIKGQRFVAVPG